LYILFETSYRHLVQVEALPHRKKKNEEKGEGWQTLWLCYTVDDEGKRAEFDDKQFGLLNIFINYVWLKVKFNVLCHIETYVYF
jgi:hypothetical protein